MPWPLAAALKIREAHTALPKAIRSLPYEFFEQTLSHLLKQRDWAFCPLAYVTIRSMKGNGRSDYGGMHFVQCSCARNHSNERLVC